MYILLTDNDNIYTSHRYCGGNNNKINIKTGYNIISLSKRNGFLLEHTNSIKRHGEWNSNNYLSSNSTILRFVIIFNNTKIKSNGLNSKFDKIIVSDRYSGFNKKIIVKSRINIDANYIDFVCYFGHLDVLEMWKNTYTPEVYLYSDIALSIASYTGNVNVLEWWKNSRLQLKYDNHSLFAASSNNHINVLEWWKNSGLHLKYDENAMNTASELGHINVLKWWKNSGLQLRYNEGTMDYASSNGKINVLNWWANSGLELKYSELALQWASQNGHIEVLKWWKNSGLKLKYYKHYNLNAMFISGNQIYFNVDRIFISKNEILIKKFWKKLGANM